MVGIKHESMRKGQTSHKKEHNTRMCFPLKPVFTRDKGGLPNFIDEATSGLDPIIRDDILEMFLDFIQDEEHSILVSSHITSDLEKIADYIVFIHGGKVLFSKPKDELLENYGIIKCNSTQFNEIDKSDIISYRKLDYEYQVLVSNRRQVEQKYPKTMIVPASIDEIMLMYVKGDK